MEKQRNFGDIWANLSLKTWEFFAVFRQAKEVVLNLNGFFLHASIWLQLIHKTHVPYHAAS